MAIDSIAEKCIRRHDIPFEEMNLDYKLQMIKVKYKTIFFFFFCLLEICNIINLTNICFFSWRFIACVSKKIFIILSQEYLIEKSDIAKIVSLYEESSSPSRGSASQPKKKVTLSK